VSQKEIKAYVPWAAYPWRLPYKYRMFCLESERWQTTAPCPTHADEGTPTEKDTRKLDFYNVSLTAKQEESKWQEIKCITRSFWTFITKVPFEFPPNQAQNISKSFIFIPN